MNTSFLILSIILFIMGVVLIYFAYKEEINKFILKLLTIVVFIFGFIFFIGSLFPQFLTDGIYISQFFADLQISNHDLYLLTFFIIGISIIFTLFFILYYGFKIKLKYSIIILISSVIIMFIIFLYISNIIIPLDILKIILFISLGVLVVGIIGMYIFDTNKNQKMENISLYTTMISAIIVTFLGLYMQFNLYSGTLTDITTQFISVTLLILMIIIPMIYLVILYFAYKKLGIMDKKDIFILILVVSVLSIVLFEILSSIHLILLIK